MYSVRRESGVLETIGHEGCYYVNDIIRHFSSKCYISDRSFPSFELIYDNIVLNNKKPLQFYKICPEKEIFMGSVEGFISRNKDLDLIVEVVVQCFVSESIFIFMKQCDQISKVKDIVSGLIQNLDSAIISDVKGEPLDNNKLLSEIFSENSNQQIFISWTPNYLHEGYNRYLIEKYFWYGGDSYEGWIKSFDGILKSIRNDLQIFKNLRINANKSLFPKTKLSKELLERSKLYFCKWYSERFYEECEQEWKSKINKDFDFSGVYYVIRIAIFIVLQRKFKGNSQSHKCSSETFDSFLIKALNLLLNKCNGGYFFMKKFMRRVYIGKMNKKTIEKKIKNYFSKYGVLKIKMINSTENLRIPLESMNLFQIKKIAQIFCGIEEELLYFVNYDEQDLKSSINMTKNITIHVEEMKRLNENQKQCIIGGGEFGNVYMCKDVDSDDEFVIKLYHNPKESVREININEDIKPFKLFSKYRGLMRYEEEICVAFTFFKESLDSKIKASFSHENIIKVAFDILTELKELHKWGIIHHDIKPANILLDNSGKATLCDFGCSKLICNQGNEIIMNIKQESFGTEDYKAPELLKKEPYSYKNDIWSLGIIIIEMIDGKLSQEIKDKIINLENIKNHSKGLRVLLEKCLKENPDERYSAEMLLKLDIFKDIRETFN